MKKFIYYTLIMITIIIILPLIIVKGCAREPKVETGAEEKKEARVENEKEKETGTEETAISVYLNRLDKVVEMDLEEYIKGVVAAEMPAAFPLEALKAQAVAARTYAYYRMVHQNPDSYEQHSGADICADHTHCQAWKSKEEAMKGWSLFSRGANWRKIERAVNETRNMILLYNGEVANPVFHANSGGRTENAEDVWGKPVPYLKSVESKGEDRSESFITTVAISKDDFISEFKKHYPELEAKAENIPGEIEILGYTEGGRVRDIKVGNIVIKGTEFRKIFCLKSANFSIEEADDETLKITTKGSGHGVGMSQWGASYLALNGKNYRDILEYYYTNIEIDFIENFEK